MYARLLFVVVGIFGPVLARFAPSSAVLPPDLAHRLCGAAPWHRRGLRIYAGAMNEAIRPGADAGDHMTTANKAIALAQADIVNAFIKHKAAAK